MPTLNDINVSRVSQKNKNKNEIIQKIEICDK